MTFIASRRLAASRRLPLAPAVLLAACAAVDLGDTEQVDPALAYVALRPRISNAGASPPRVDLSLVCVDEKKHSRTLYLPGAANERTLLVRTPPGACYLEGIRSGPVRAGFKPVTTAFAAHPGVINYAGDWQIVLDPRVVVTIGVGYSDHSGVQGQVVKNAVTTAEIERDFPKLSSKLRIVYTGPN